MSEPAPVDGGPEQRAAGPVHLRPATWRDIPAMARLEQVAFAADPWDEASLWAELAQRPRRNYVVAEADSGPGLLGYAGLDLAGDVGDVMTVVVDPVARGRGVGALLLAHLHDLADAAGAGAMMLEVRADNDAARHLYDTRGYHLIHTRPGYYRGGDGPAVDALVMRKELKPS